MEYLIIFGTMVLTSAFGALYMWRAPRVWYDRKSHIDTPLFRWFRWQKLRREIGKLDSLKKWTDTL